MDTTYPRVWCLLNYKGGTGKTTSSAMLLHALRAQGRAPIGVDADPQGSLITWAASWESPAVPVVAMPTAGIHRQLWGVIDRERFTDVVLDTPPIEQQGGIVQSALMLTGDAGGTVIVPLGPSTIEYDRIPDAYEALKVNGLDPGTAARVLMNRIKGGRLSPTSPLPRSTSARTIMGQLSADGWNVLGTWIPHRDAEAIAYGAPVVVSPEYAAAAAELTGTGTDTP